MTKEEMDRVQRMGHSVEEIHLMVEAFSPDTEQAFAEMACNHPDKCVCTSE